MLGTAHGAGDGSTTFNLPNYRGRVGAGRDDMNGTAANRLTAGNSGIAGTTLWAAGGDERLASHSHTATQAAHSHQLFYNEIAGGSTIVDSFNGGQNAGGSQNTSSVAPAITVNSAGSGTAANVQPTIVENVGIYAGV